MTYRRRFIGGALLAATLIGLPGCSMFKSMFYELQPYRLHRWNRTEALGGGTDDYNLSISDPIPALASPNVPLQQVNDGGVEYGHIAGNGEGLQAPQPQ